MKKCDSIVLKFCVNGIVITSEQADQFNTFVCRTVSAYCFPYITAKAVKSSSFEAIWRKEFPWQSYGVSTVNRNLMEMM